MLGNVVGDVEQDVGVFRSGKAEPVDRGVVGRCQLRADAVSVQSDRVIVRQGGLSRLGRVVALFVR